MMITYQVRETDDSATDISRLSTSSITGKIFEMVKSSCSRFPPVGTEDDVGDKIVLEEAWSPRGKV